MSRIPVAPYAKELNKDPGAVEAHLAQPWYKRLLPPDALSEEAIGMYKIGQALAQRAISAWEVTVRNATLAVDYSQAADMTHRYGRNRPLGASAAAREVPKNASFPFVFGANAEDTIDIARAARSAHNGLLPGRSEDTHAIGSVAISTPGHRSHARKSQGLILAFSDGMGEVVDTVTVSRERFENEQLYTQESITSVTGLIAHMAQQKLRSSELLARAEHMND